MKMKNGLKYLVKNDLLLSTVEQECSVIDPAFYWSWTMPHAKNVGPYGTNLQFQYVAWYRSMAAYRIQY